MQYTAKGPATVDAIKWTGDNLAEMEALAGKRLSVLPENAELCGWQPRFRGSLKIDETPIGSPICVPIGDWLVKANGALRPLTADQFTKMYVVVIP